MDSERTVLLVHPHVDCREMYAEFLRECGLSTIAVGDGEDALTAARDADVVVTGLLVPTVDGIELIRRLRTGGRTKDTPIIVLTACAFPADRQRAEAAGCDAFLPMPCSPADLLREIRRMLLKTVRRRPVDVDADRTRVDQKRNAS